MIARAARHGPPDRLRLGLDRDRPLRADDLRDQELGRRREAGDPDAVVRLGGDQPGDERAVALRVDGRRAADEALAPRRSGRGARDACRRRPSRSRRPAPARAVAARARRRRRGSGPRTTGAARNGSFGTNACRRAAEPLDVRALRRPRAAARRLRRETRRAPGSGEVDDRGCSARPQRPGDRSAVGSRVRARRRTGRPPRRRRAEARQETAEDAATPTAAARRAVTSRLPAATVIVSAGPDLPLGGEPVGRRELRPDGDGERAVRRRARP